MSLMEESSLSIFDANLIVTKILAFLRIVFTFFMNDYSEN